MADPGMMRAMKRPESITENKTSSSLFVDESSESLNARLQTTSVPAHGDRSAVYLWESTT